jgi:N-acetyl-alpha-D-muramate 1-phosphate uridylyltransferase
MMAVTEGMVLAAGKGLRMRPLTEQTPKPLLSAGGETLLDHALRTLADSGVSKAVINGHYLGEQIVRHVTAYAGPLMLRYSDETDQLLETGGGVVKALPMLGGDAFFVLNADNLWVPARIPVLDQLRALWDPERMDALLLMVPLARATGYDGQGDFRMDGDGRLSRRVPPRVAPFAFAGAQILARTLLEGQPVEPFSLNRVYDIALERGRLFGTAHLGPWFHVGTPDGLALARAGLGFDAAD